MIVHACDLSTLVTRDSSSSSSRLLGLNSRVGKKTGKELGDDVENHRVVGGGDI